MTSGPSYCDIQHLKCIPQCFISYHANIHSSIYNIYKKPNSTILKQPIFGDTNILHIYRYDKTLLGSLILFKQDQRSTAVPSFPLYHSVNQLSQMWPKYDNFIAKTWSSHGPSNGIFLNLNQCAKGCSMLNFTLLAKSCSPFS